MTHSCRRFLLLLLAALLVEAAHIHTIRVGFAGSHVFDPTTTTADVGDLVVFEFFPTNHSVVRGEYTESEACGSSQCNPCVPYELIHPGQTGFHSENFLTQTVSTNGNVFSQHSCLLKMTNAVRPQLST
jgi:plastocyanin